MSADALHPVKVNPVNTAPGDAAVPTTNSALSAEVKLMELNDNEPKFVPTSDPTAQLVSVVVHEAI